MQNSAAGDGENPSSRQKVAVAIVFVVAMFINILDATVVNVALPSIAGDFEIPVDQTATINIGFLVAVAVMIPVSGWLGDRLGARGVFTVAVALFTVASAACGLSDTLAELVIFRIFQGVAGGLMTPVGMSMLYRSYPPAERIRLGSITTVPIAFAPALGPVVGGLLTEHAGWEWIFWINVPIGIAATIFTLVAVKPLARTTTHRLDFAGFVLAGVGFAGLMYALSEGPSRGWLTPGILISGIVGVILLAALVPVELRSTAPMIQLRLLALRLFRAANLVTMLSSAGFIGALFAYPLMLQSALRFSPLEAGLLTFPEAIGVMLGVQIAARFYSRIGPRAQIAGGQLVTASVLVSIALAVRIDTPPAVPIALMFVIGIGQAHTFMPTQAAAFDTVPKRSTGEATSIYNVFRQAGAAIGVALAASVMAVVGLPAVSAAGDTKPFTVALLACAACSIAAAMVAAFAIHNEDAAPSRGLSLTS
ncbi:MAG: DHA2 family efflux MFS transporter permease subunit [Nakamurella sp.]